MKVELTYYKASGKYYTAGEYDSPSELIHDVVAEVRRRREVGTLPGLVPSGGKHFAIHVKLPSGLSHIIPPLPEAIAATPTHELRTAEESE